MRLSTAKTNLEPVSLAGDYRLFAPLAVSGLVSTIALIMVGAIVRVTGHGLGCPDWPLCHGQAIPPFYLSAWVEFIHRLFGGAVVLQVAALIVLAWRRYRPVSALFQTANLAAAALTVQVVLGGFHVIYELPRWTGWLHTGLAMLLAGILAYWVALTSTWASRLNAGTRRYLRQTRLPLWTTVAAAATYILLLTGSLVTRSGASLVCPDFPACGLSQVPAGLRLIVAIQLVHRWSAFIVAFAICLVLFLLLRRARTELTLRRYAAALVGLLVLQFSLGMINVWFAIPMWTRVLHLGTGATIWAVMVMLTTAVRAPDAVPHPA